ncbi:hypothetical protein CCPUN_04190 [Cardinium endosymbiont of Culicoides punctatus]|nr:hypothetical protein CCPUN_04190 [Cardinium endosymbiont of Culicoides punctatus]
MDNQQNNSIYQQKYLLNHNLHVTQCIQESFSTIV